MNYKNNQKQIFLEKCKEIGLKVTPQRVAIFEELDGDTSHPNVQEIYDRIRIKIPNISFDTVNRTLLSFADIGLLEVIPVRGRAKRFDPCTATHSHFLCIRCGKLIDVEGDDFDEIKVPSSLDDHVILSKKIILEGICSDCK